MRAVQRRTVCSWRKAEDPIGRRRATRARNRPKGRAPTRHAMQRSAPGSSSLEGIPAGLQPRRDEATAPSTETRHRRTTRRRRTRFKRDHPERGTTTPRSNKSQAKVEREPGDRGTADQRPARPQTWSQRCWRKADSGSRRSRQRSSKANHDGLGPVNTYLSASKMSTKWMKPMNITSSFSNRENIRR